MKFASSHSVNIMEIFYSFVFLFESLLIDILLFVCMLDLSSLSFIILSDVFGGCRTLLH